MTQPGVPPDPLTAADPVEFVERLRQLRVWAGEPSLRRLRELAGTTVDARGRIHDALPVSTISHVLRSSQLPRMKFVQTYVNACLTFRSPALDDPPGDQIDRWQQAWLAVRSRSDGDQPSEGVHNDRATAGMPVRPRQLPAPPPLFTGRERELESLDDLDASTAVAIATIDGMAGIGKTALAIHAAHRLTEHYPDGQLFLDLHGYTNGIAPLEPADALDHLLRALAIPGPQIPQRLDQRAALYRSRLAGQRMLIVLDNATTETQVTPLLPGSAGCLVLVTSRRRLAGFDPTHALSLDTLPLPDAVVLLRKGTGEGRVAGQPPGAMEELVDLCGRLPLAIRIAAARLRSHPAWNLAHLMQRLRDQRHRLVELEAGQRGITATLNLSYQDLSTDQRRTYRLLGLHPGPDIDAYATAALLDSTLHDAGRMIEQLLDVHLLQEPVPGRYRFHDLTRVHAVQAATDDETDSGRRGALNRLLDFQCYTASVAMDAAYPYDRERWPQAPRALTPVPALSDPAAALGWLDSELPNLLAAARHAAEHGWPAYILRMSTILHRHLHARGRYDDAVALHHQALTTARATGHEAAEREALVDVGHIYLLQGRYDEATDSLERALQSARTAGDHRRELYALTSLGNVHWLRGRNDEAADHLGQALQVAHATGNRPGELYALTGLGQVYQLQGRYDLAIDHFERARQLARATGNHRGELNALTGLGNVHWLRGRNDEAADHLGQALQVAHATGNRPGELYALNGLGRVHRLQGRIDLAIDHFERALRLARAIGDRTGELDALSGLGKVDRSQGRYDHATDHYQHLLDLAHECGDRNFEFEAQQGLGQLRQATGRPDAAITHHDRALALASELGQPGDQARALDGLAHANQALHQTEQARRHWQQALDILTRLGIDQTDDAETSAEAIRTHLGSVRRDPGRGPTLTEGEHLR